MGKTVEASQRGVGAERLQGTRICLDLSENVHLHYRDIRMEMSVEEWKAFCAFVEQAGKFVEGEKDYVEGDVNAFAQVTGDALPMRSTYHAGRAVVERLENGEYHIHWHDVRIELTKDSFDALLSAMQDMARRE